RPRRGRVPAHSRREMARAAVALADRDGLGAVTMRSVAQSLGTGQASLYRYVNTRDELVALMVDEVTGELGLHGPDERPWADQMLDLAKDARAVYRRHPWMVESPGTTTLGPNGYAYLEHVLAVLAPTRTDGATMLEAVAVFNAVTRLLCAEEHERRRTDGTGPGTGTHSTASAAPADALSAGSSPTGSPPAHAYPHLTAALSDADADASPDRQFERVLRRVLTGLVPEGDTR
ncbi:TetR/AcrR family transcriptional regulator, partial [Promicromonospora kroppenstedtii]|uniref:TetR/AcrR family transcriptional regulator n=1 Tax=Promicromonospora kroppenstedtii TaxID=440482 RepID=UPI001B7F927E